MLYVYLDDSKNFLYRETDLKYADFVVKNIRINIALTYYVRVFFTFDLYFSHGNGIHQERKKFKN